MSTAIRGETTVSVTDYTGKVGVTKINTAPLDASNFDAVSTLIDNYITAYGNVTLGAVNTRHSGNVIETVPPVAAAAGASRGARIAWTYQDQVTGRIFTNVTSSRDSTKVPQVAGQPNINLAGTYAAPYKTAFEALAKSVDGNAVVITKARWVGRN